MPKRKATSKTFITSMIRNLKDSELDKNSSEVESQKSEDKENENMENEGKSCNIYFLSNDAQIIDFI